MRLPFPAATRTALVLALPVWLVASAAAGQDNRPAPGGGGDHGGGARSAPAPSAPSAPSGGSGGAASAGSPSGGGNGGGHAGSGGFTHGGDSGGERRGGGATGSGGVAAPREGRTANGGGNAGSAAPRGSSGGEGHVNTAVPNGERGHRAAEGSGKAANSGSGGAGGGSGVPTYARPVAGNQPVGTAVPRGTTPPPPGSGLIFVPGGYYGYGYGYYDPWAFGAAGYGFYGGYYDPWYGGYPGDPQAGTFTPSNDEGKLRLKVKPREAEVYVDGYYAGQVDDFDGIFQRLHLDSGAHRIEIRAPGYESLSFDVRITPDHTTTYEGELKKIQ
jgi:PEGA domain